jgi:hypothetical protein
MSQQNKTTLQSNINSQINDNTSGEISAADVRNNLINITDSLLFNSGSQGLTGSFNQASASLTTGIFSSAQGLQVTASGDYSHAEGWYVAAFGSFSHAEGFNTIALGEYSHAEGANAQANGNSSHAEGSGIASGVGSHAEGSNTAANGIFSHAEGEYTTATGDYSHAEGLATVASGSYQHVQGQYNTQGDSTSLMIIGNGTTSSRKDAFKVRMSGSIILPTTQSSSPAWSGLDGEIIPATVGGKYFLYMWMAGAWRSGSFV